MDDTTKLPPLTPRQLEIVRLRAQGLTIREVAMRLVLAVQTVKNHTRSILQRTGCKSMTEVVDQGNKEGWL